MMMDRWLINSFNIDMYFKVFPHLGDKIMPVFMKSNMLPNRVSRIPRVLQKNLRQIS